MLWDLSREQQKLRKRMKVCHQALAELEVRAGIAEATEKLREEAPDYLSVYDAAEPHSDEQRELEASVEKWHEVDKTRRIRQLYFTVPDIDLRKALITKVREEENLGVRFWQEELSDAAVRRSVAETTGSHWWVVASLWGVGLIGLGYYLFGIIGAMGGLLVGYFCGWSLQSSARRARQSAIAKAQEELKEAEATWDKTRNDPLTFSQREARTGKPDQEDDDRLRAVT
jgi:hypothetical protein